jgi:hypothetical protein
MSEPVMSMMCDFLDGQTAATSAATILRYQGKPEALVQHHIFCATLAMTEPTRSLPALSRKGMFSRANNGPTMDTLPRKQRDGFHRNGSHGFRYKVLVESEDQQASSPM